jgi:type VI protein secretion system component Hcp
LGKKISGGIPMHKKTHKQQLSTDDLLKPKTRDIELTEKELGQVTGGDKKIDKASTTLMQQCSGGKHLNDATIIT